MRPADSSYDRSTAGWRAEDLGEREYALVVAHNGPCSLVGDYPSLAAAIEAARGMDTDSAPTELEDQIGYDGYDDCDDEGLLAAAQAAGWVVVARAPAGEYWTVLVQEGEPDLLEACKAALKQIAGGDYQTATSWKNLCNKLDQAIAKAEGINE